MKSIIYIVFILLLAGQGMAQPKWQRSKPATKVDLALFRDTNSANLPTTETLKQWGWQYQISHRFQPAINDGFDQLYGLDGPVNMRTAVSLGLTNHLMVTLGRSGLLDNLDLQVKQKLLQLRSDAAPGVIAVLAGLGWSTEMPVTLSGEKLRSRTDSRNLQPYVQLIYNVMLLNDKLGIGVVPSYLYNSAIFTRDVQYTFTIGNYYQFFLNEKWSLWVEYNPIVAGYQGIVGTSRSETESGKSHNSLAFGIGIDTGGHMFQLMVTNNYRVNAAHYLVGSDRSASDNGWRLGFAISRHL